jgi:hypothetical protein
MESAQLANRHSPLFKPEVSVLGPPVRASHTKATKHHSHEQVAPTSHLICCEARWGVCGSRGCRAWSRGLSAVLAAAVTSSFMASSGILVWIRVPLVVLVPTPVFD